VLGSQYGGKGAAVAAVVAELVLASVSCWFVLRAAPQLRPEAGFALKVVGALAAGVAAGLLTGLPALVACVLAAIVYLGILAVLRAFPQELVDAVLRRPVPPAAGK
jgi:hypothetical protein